MVEFREKSKPKQFREWVAMLLVRLAQRIYPKSEAVTAFYVSMLHEQMIYGSAIVKHDDVYTSYPNKPDSGEDFWGGVENDKYLEKARKAIRLENLRMSNYIDKKYSNLKKKGGVSK